MTDQKTPDQEVAQARALITLMSQFAADITALLGAAPAQQAVPRRERVRVQINGTTSYIDADSPEGRVALESGKGELLSARINK